MTNNGEGVDTESQSLKAYEGGYIGTPEGFTNVGDVTFNLPKYGSPNFKLNVGINVYNSGGTVLILPNSLTIKINVPILRRGGLFYKY